jgi:hypothetical protein
MREEIRLTRRGFAGVASCAVCGLSGFLAEDASGQSAHAKPSIGILLALPTPSSARRCGIPIAEMRAPYPPELKVHLYCLDDVFRPIERIGCCKHRNQDRQARSSNLTKLLGLRRLESTCGLAGRANGLVCVFKSSVTALATSCLTPCRRRRLCPQRGGLSRQSRTAKRSSV